MSINVIFLIQNMSRAAGSERATALIANGLVEYGYNVSIVSICGSNSSFYNLDNRIKLSTLIDKQFVNNKKNSLKILRLYNKYLKRHKADIVIDVFASMSFFTNLLKKRYKIKNITWEHYNYKNNMGFYGVYRYLAIKYSDKIITLTHCDKEMYGDRHPELGNRVDYIYNPSPYQNTFINNDKNKNVLAVGRLEKIKGFTNLLDVWKIVEDKLNDYSLIIIGEGEERVVLENKIHTLKLKNVQLIGQIKNIEDYYNTSKILVSTSYTEGLPMNMIEAQSFGLPIVSYDYYSGPRDIITNGINGYIVFDEDIKVKNRMMATAIIKVLENKELLKRLSYNSLIASKRFSFNPILDKWVCIIKSLL